MEITKTKTDFGSIITIIEGTKIFKIQYGGNLDLYWSIYNRSNGEEQTYETFEISKENYYVYNVFDTLYESIKNCDIYDNDDDDLFLSYSLSEEEKEKNNRRQKEKLKRVQKGLFINNSIVWYSDDGDYEYDEIVKISKLEDIFLLEFLKVPKQDKDINHYLRFSHLGISIRFRNSGCRYEPFELAFMKVYNQLCKYDPEYHQTHLEEYNNEKQKRLLK